MEAQVQGAIQLLLKAVPRANKRDEVVPIEDLQPGAPQSASEQDSLRRPKILVKVRVDTPSQRRSPQLNGAARRGTDNQTLDRQSYLNGQASGNAARAGLNTRTCICVAGR